MTERTTPTPTPTPARGGAAPWAAALVIGGMLALAAGPSRTIVPTIDGASISQLIETVTTGLKQIQSLRQLGRSLLDVKDSIGSVASVEAFKDALLSDDITSAIDAPAWLDAAQNAITGARGENEEQRDPDTGPGESPVLVRGGTIEEWDPDTAIDRPQMGSAGEAMKWTVEELYGIGLPNHTGSNRLAAQEVRRMRRHMEQSAALNAYAVGSAAPAAMERYEQERAHLAEQLDSAVSLREETSVSALASIAALSGRAEQTLISAAALELRAIEVISRGPALITSETRERLIAIAGGSPE